MIGLGQQRDLAKCTGIFDLPERVKKAIRRDSQEYEYAARIQNNMLCKRRMRAWLQHRGLSARTGVRPHAVARRNNLLRTGTDD